MVLCQRSAEPARSRSQYSDDSCAPKECARKVCNGSRISLHCLCSVPAKRVFSSATRMIGNPKRKCMHQLPGRPRSYFHLLCLFSPKHAPITASRAISRDQHRERSGLSDGRTYHPPLKCDTIELFVCGDLLNIRTMPSAWGLQSP